MSCHAFSRTLSLPVVLVFFKKQWYNNRPSYNKAIKKRKSSVVDAVYNVEHRYKYQLMLGTTVFHQLYAVPIPVCTSVNGTGKRSGCDITKNHVKMEKRGFISKVSLWWTNKQFGVRFSEWHSLWTGCGESGRSGWIFWDQVPIKPEMEFIRMLVYIKLEIGESSGLPLAGDVLVCRVVLLLSIRISSHILRWVDGPGVSSGKKLT